MTYIGVGLATGEAALEVGVLILTIINALGSTLFYDIRWATIVEGVMAGLNMVFIVIAVMVPYSIATDTGKKRMRLNPFTMHFVGLFIIHGLFLTYYAVLWTQCTAIGALCPIGVFPVFGSGLHTMDLLYLRYEIALVVNSFVCAIIVKSFLDTYSHASRVDRKYTPADRQYKSKHMGNSILESLSMLASSMRGPF